MASAEEVASGSVGSGSHNRRGKVDNQKRLSAFSGKSRAGNADWGSADARWVTAVIVKMCSLGGAVTFGLARDGGAHMLTLLLSGERQTLWFNGDADLDAELEAVYQTLETL